MATPRRARGCRRRMASTAGAVLAGMLLAAVSTVLAGAQAVPANDAFAAATVVNGANGTINGSNVSATKEPGEPDHAGSGGGASIWYSWLAPTTGPVTVTTVGSNFDTLLGVYTGTSVSGLTTIASNDDISGSVYQSSVAFNTVAGTAYRISVDGWRNNAGVPKTGSSTLNWSLATAPVVPTNDAFSAAETIAGIRATVAGSTVGGTKESGEPKHVSNNTGGASIWYAWVAPATGPATITTVGSTFDTVLAVYIGSHVSSLTKLTSNDDISRTISQSSVSFSAVSGTTYRIAVDGWRTGSSVTTGIVALNWAITAPPIGPPNDNFATAQVVSASSGTVAGTSIAATKEPGEPNHLPSNGGGASVWYRWTAPTTGQATITTVGSSFDTVLAVYTGSSIDALTSVVWNDDISGSVYQSSVVFAAMSGTTYRIAVDGYRGSAGSAATGQISVTWGIADPTAPPANDQFADAEAVVGPAGNASGSNVGATKQTGEPNHVAGNAGGASIWYRWIAPTSGDVTISTVGSSFDTGLAAYTGAGVGALQLVAANDDISPGVYQSRATFAVVAGTTYQIAVDGWRNIAGVTASGVVTFDWSLIGTGDAVLAAAGDVASCFSSGDEATAAVLASLPSATVALLGDGAYPDGAPEDYTDCYESSWGAVKARTQPTPGNHDYFTPDAAGYFAYFGSVAGDPATGYYSYDLGSWHVVALNSQCSHVGGCGAGSAQEQWLRADLAAHPAACTLAYWHEPLFSSGNEGVDPQVRPLWQALYDSGAEVVLTGHDHMYERFAAQRANGTPDDDRGIREFVVGTGGASHGTVTGVAANSQIRNTTTSGALVLTLRPNGYDWRFTPVAGQTFTDAGSGTCHAAP